MGEGGEGVRREAGLTPVQVRSRMANDDLHFLTLARAGDLIAKRELAPTEYLEALIARIERFEPQIHAFVTKTFDLARAQAKAAEREIAGGRYRGPLHGIPIGLKDIIDLEGVTTTGHSRVCIDNVATANAAVTERLLSAGAVVIGKLATHEFASGGPSLDLPWPPARNPWNTAHFTGSSSSGSGAAVAAGFVPGALGSDTGGSIRIPAALCGVAGIKPTYGLVSRRGVMPNSYTFDHVGPLSWTTEDCAILLQCIAGHDEKDPGSALQPIPDYRQSLSEDLRGVRIGVIRHFWEEEGRTDPELAAAMDAALEVLGKLGARVEDTRMRPRQAYADVKMAISKSEIASIHEKDMRERLQDYGADFVGRNLAGFLFSGADYMHAQRERRIMLAEMQPLYERYDVLITATGTPAPTISQLLGVLYADKWKNPDLYSPFNVTGGPAAVVCNGFSKSGLPLGMQIVSRPFNESGVFRVGHAYEKATEWRKRRPRLVAGAEAPVLEAPKTKASSGVEITPQVRLQVDAMIARLDLRLSDEQRAMLYEVAPSVLETARRVRGDRLHVRSDEPASAFRFS